MEKLCGYTLEGDMTSKNAGYSLWCFGTRNGKEYFIKQFLTPKYPYQDTVSSPERLAKKTRQCAAFVEQKRKLYDTVNSCSDGNDVRICSFFRHETKYYIAMEKIEALPWAVSDLAARTEEEKRYLCAMVSHAVAALHEGGMVHADLKHDNILYTRTANGNITAKVIDFDSGFLEEDPPKTADEISGDWIYFAPETWRCMNGDMVALTRKLDVFALGVLFHQYFSGRLPAYPPEYGATSVGQAILRGASLTIAEEIPADIAALIREMLDPDPDRRPTAYETFSRLQPQRIRDYLESKGVVDRLKIRRICASCGREFIGDEELCPACADGGVESENLRDLDTESGSDEPTEPNAGAQQKNGSFFYKPADL